MSVACTVRTITNIYKVRFFGKKLMELETFLEGIENCPNEIVSRYAGGGRIEKEQRLCAEWGITDNYLILLKTGLRKVSRFFGEDQNYTLEKAPYW